MKIGKFVIASLLLMTASACVATSNHQDEETVIPAIDTSLFGKRPKNIPTLQDIYGVNKKHREHFLTFYNDEKNQHIDGHRRIARYVETLLNDFNYNEQTLVVNESLDLLAGDCMSLATLTSALAYLVDVDINYRYINNSPHYDQRGDLILRTHHVRTILFDPAYEVPKGLNFFFIPSVKIDFFPLPGDVQGKRISQREFVAMFYRNLAAVELTEKNYRQAFWLLNEAVNIAPHDAENINMLAILHRHSGFIDKAEELYRFGLEIADSKVALLRNYRILLQAENRFEEAEQISKQLVHLDDPNPFNWIHLAANHYSKNDYRDAIHFYNKAAKAAPHLHHPYFGLAKCYFAQGKYDKAQRALQTALDNTKEDVIRDQYQKKFDELLMVSHKRNT